jgi:hypothetical protein
MKFLQEQQNISNAVAADSAKSICARLDQSQCLVPGLPVVMMVTSRSGRGLRQ